VLTIFSVPKAFHGHTGIIQTNAIRSWLMLRPQPEIILFGDDEGTANKALQLGIRHVPDVQRNEYGTPLLDSIFKTAQEIASNSLTCYINADIILLSDFLPAISQIRTPSFLLVGQRWDLDLSEAVDYADPDWEKQLRDRLAEKGTLHPRSGMDYFVFPRGMYSDIPPFAIGRSMWDNWIAYEARALRFPLIDGTEVITAIHQNHDYSNIRGGEAGVWKGPEAELNLKLAGPQHAFTIEHATWKLTQKGTRRALTARHLYFRLMAVPVLYPKTRFLSVPLRVLNNSIIYLRKSLGMAPKNQ
jgi:hypothetical protein